MKSIRNYILALPICLCAGNAMAMPPGNWYWGLSGDLTWLNRSDMGGGGNADLGYRFAPTSTGDFRLEGEFGYHQAGADNSSGSNHYYSYFANTYYDFNGFRPSAGSNWHLSPYLGAGLGAATMDYQGFGNSTGFAYQFMTGLSLVSNTTPSPEWYLGYRYTGSDSTGGMRVNSNNVELGVRFHF